MTIEYTQEEYDNAKSSDLLPLRCENCGKTFYIAKKLISHELKYKKGKCKYCSSHCFQESRKNTIKVHCQKCGKEIEIKTGTYNLSNNKHFFCSKSCAASYNNKNRTLSKETREKIANSVIKKYENSNVLKRVCKVCGKEYRHIKSVYPGSTKMVCSEECKEKLKKERKKYLSDATKEKLSAAGRKSINLQGDVRRSKNEIYFCELCENYFKNVKHNELIFNGWDADIIIEDIKTAVLWNGKWHYEKITEKQSIEQIQNRDTIKMKEIEKCGYKPYIIKDMGKYNPNFVKKEFQKLIAG